MHLNLNKRINRKLSLLIECQYLSLYSAFIEFFLFVNIWKFSYLTFTRLDEDKKIKLNPIIFFKNISVMKINHYTNLKFILLYGTMEDQVFVICTCSVGQLNKAEDHLIRTAISLSTRKYRKMHNLLFGNSPKKNYF